MGEWLYYIFAAGSFHTKKVCSKLYYIEIKLYFKKIKNRFWATVWETYGNVRTPSIDHWKARGQLSIRHNWTFFAISYGWDVISENLPKSVFFEEGRPDGSLRAQISDVNGVAHQPLLVSEN